MNTQFQLEDGTPVTIKPCSDNRYPNCHLVSLGGYGDHTTFIVRDEDLSIIGYDAHGKEKDAFRLLLNSIAQGGY